MSNVRTTHPAGVDLRGFRYVLEPLTKRHEWEMSRLQNQLGRAQSKWQLVQEQKRNIDHLHQHHSQELRQRTSKQLDPQRHQAGLAYLATLRSRIVKYTSELSVLRHQVEQLRAQCVAQQLMLDGLFEHRAHAVKQYASHKVQQHAVESDRDWIMRSRWTGALGASTPQVTNSGGRL
jgi:flagellar biosynthesis chaperone FliJ